MKEHNDALPEIVAAIAERDEIKLMTARLRQAKAEIDAHRDTTCLQRLLAIRAREARLQQDAVLAALLECAGEALDKVMGEEALRAMLAARIRRAWVARARSMREAGQTYEEIVAFFARRDPFTKKAGLNISVDAVRKAVIDDEKTPGIPA